MKTEFLPIDYDYFDFEGRNVVKIVGRDSKGKRICAIDSCDIYFWAILKDGLSENKIKSLIEKISKIKVKSANRETKVEKVELHDKNFLDKSVKALKIFATNYKDLHDIADHLALPEIEKRRGYDISFMTHYIIEKKLNPLAWYEIEGQEISNSDDFGGIGKAMDVDYCIKLESHKQINEKEFTPKTLCFDIEADDLKIGKGEILMISLVSENFKKVISWKNHKIKADYIEHVKDESELIEKFVEYVKKLSPDFLVGYFSDGFDLPYLKARAEANKVKLALNLDNSQPVFSRGVMMTAKTKGLVHLDLLRFIRTAYAQYMQSETLSLNEVAREFLGDEKKPFQFKHSSKIKDSEWEQYFEYNLHDSNLVYQLFQKFWPDILTFSRVVKEPPSELTRAGLSKYVEGYILHNLSKFNEIPERRPKHEELSKRKYQGPVEGAFVLEPKPGLYEKVAIFDFTSMHTSIIISMNISKSTLLENEPLKKVPKQELEKNSNTIETKMGKFSFTKKPGFIPLLLKEIFELRKKAKAEYKENQNIFTKARSNAFKVLSASVHGYIAFFGARYYSKEASSSILGYVRKFNQETIKNIEKEGYKVVYGDTDSICFVMGDKTESDVKFLLEKLNKNLPGIMELELEDFYVRGIWVTTRTGKSGAKKKYALLDKKGKLKIRGFETVRRDWCVLARNLQNKVINLILEDGDEKRALEHLKTIIKKVRTRNISKEEIIIKSQLKKPILEYKAISPHVIAAKKMQEKNIPLGMGSLLEFYISESKEKKALVRDRVKLPDEKGEYDINYYLNHQILPAVENIFQVFKIDVNELIEGKKQKTLGDF
jgi:DNA polymerase I/DNA polymerase-2